MGTAVQANAEPPRQMTAPFTDKVYRTLSLATVVCERPEESEAPVWRCEIFDASKWVCSIDGWDYSVMPGTGTFCLHDRSAIDGQNRPRCET
jgi:hypothetical protein